MWYLQESSQGHTDFQSVALPTELRYLASKQIKKSLSFETKAFNWYLQESNQGHTDFQSVALPTELRYH